MYRRGKQLMWALLCVSTFSASAGECTVAVASNFSGPMKAVVAAFAASFDHDVTLSFGSSGKFYAQISNGAPFDVFLSADQARVDALETKDLTVTDSRFTYATGRLALWTSQVRQPAIGRDRLARGDFKRVALANPRLAPYGRAAAEVLATLGVDHSKRVMGENVAQAFAFVHSGNADIGFVALSQVIENPNSKTAPPGSILWRVDSALHKPIHQDAVLLKKAADNHAARDLMAFLRSALARDIIATFGYDVETLKQSNPATAATVSNEA